MKTQLEYIYDSKNSKIWIIEQKAKTIKILFGKKNSSMNEKILNYSTEIEAKEDYKKRILEKLKKGYQNIETLIKKINSKSKSNNKKKK